MVSLSVMCSKGLDDLLFIEEGSGLLIPRGMLTVFGKQYYGTRRTAEEYEGDGEGGGESF
jgi:hypothetical protein